MLNPPNNLRERILVCGGPGSGKTSGLLHIAKMYQLTNTPGHFYIIETDPSWERMLAGPNFNMLNNVSPYLVGKWEDYMAMGEVVRDKAQQGDWIGIDFITPAWDESQTYYIEQVFNKGITQFAIDVRKEMDSSPDTAKMKRGGHEGRKDWTWINKIYRDWAVPLLYRTQAHIYATAQLAQIDSKNEDEPTQQMFGSFGVKPKGQKDLGYQFDTVLWSRCVKVGKDYRLTTMKDRERVVLEGTPYTNFVSTYLMPIAGWTT